MMEILYSLLYMLNEMSPYILLGFLIAGLLHAFVSRLTFARHLSGTGVKPVVKAALFGIPLPLCSCGVIPTAISLRRSGASRAASTSFLVATPQTGVDSIAATWSLLGPAFAVVRPVAALVTALFAGVSVGKTEKGDADTCTEAVCAAQPEAEDDRPKGFWPRMTAALRYGYVDLVASIGTWLVIGLLVAALITVYVPADFFAAFGRWPIVSMLGVLIVAIPMYVCATGSIPIAMSLMLKGLSPGTALVLLMAGPAANFASFSLIAREMGRKAAFVYLAAIVAGAIGFGLLIDYLLPASWFSLHNTDMAQACHHHFSIFSTTCSVILAVLLIFAFIRRHKKTHLNTTAMTKKYIVKGMNCPHCQASVAKAVKGVEGVTDAEVNLSTGEVTVQGNPDDKAIADAVRAAGFDMAD